MKLKLSRYCSRILLVALLLPAPGCEGTDEVFEVRFALRDLEPEEAEFLRIINEYRAAGGLGSLTATRTLNQAAYDHSLDMAVQDYFDHTSLDGRSPWDRMCEAGHEPACSMSAAMAENIAAGNASASATFEQWRTSPGHNANMLDGRFTAIGIGRAYGASSSYGYYWTTDFSSVVDEVSCFCSSGDTRPCSSECGSGLQHCDDGCNWGHCDAPLPSAEVCDGADNDCDGAIDEDGVCGEECVPSEEICDGIDNDCDGVIDPSCTCLSGETQTCGITAPPCVQGVQTCVDGTWGPCEGSVEPEPEICDGVDNDCNGMVDDSPLCSGGLPLGMEGGCGCAVVL
jgi:hypothetical protein